MNEKIGAKHGAIFKRVVDRDCRPGEDVLVIDIGGNANDAVRRLGTRLFRVGSGKELEHGIAPVNMVADGIPVGEHGSGERLTHDDHGFRSFGIASVEITSGEDRNTKGGKESRGDGAPPRARIVDARLMGVAIAGKLQGKTLAVTPGNDIAEGG